MFEENAVMVNSDSIFFNKRVYANRVKEDISRDTYPQAHTLLIVEEVEYHAANWEVKMDNEIQCSGCGNTFPFHSRNLIRRDTLVYCENCIHLLKVEEE